MLLQDAFPNLYIAHLQAMDSREEDTNLARSSHFITRKPNVSLSLNVLKFCWISLLFKGACSDLYRCFILTLGQPEIGFY